MQHNTSYLNFNDIKSFLYKNNISSLENIFFNNSKIGFLDYNDYFIADTSWHKNIINDVNFEYKINEHGYRSKHFKTLDLQNINILYGGCSVTFGEGLPNYCRWVDILYDKLLNKHGSVEYYDTSFIGNSIDIIIKNVMSFIYNYGKPNYIFLCFPPISRKIIFDDKKQKYFKSTPAHHWLEKSKDRMQILSLVHKDPEHVFNIQQEHTIKYKYEENIYLHSLLINLLENFCKESGIKLMWTCWDIEDNILFNELKFDFFVPLNFNHLSYQKNNNNLPYWELAKDGAHPGTGWNTLLAETFYNEVNNV